uniref:Uncharacterized protein n=1 Tax=Lygus hesperus TaxID=30085 RepID=A0A146KUC1_LYGHE
MMAQTQPTKLQPYDSDFPTIWLAQVRMACAAEKLTTEADKFRRAFLALDTKTAELVASIDPTSDNPFTQLCNTLLTAHAPNDGSQLEALLATTSLDDTTPSEYARKIQRSLPEDTPDCIIRQLFLRALPKDIRLIIAALQHTNVTQLATIADQLIKLKEPIYSAAVSSPTSPNELNSEHIMSTGKPNTQPNVQPFNSRRRPPFRRQQQRSRRLCIYHYRWGNQARQCRQPCSWKQPTHVEQRRNTTIQGNDNAQLTGW